MARSTPNSVTIAAIRKRRSAGVRRGRSCAAELRYTNPIGLIGWMYNAHVTKSTAHSPAQVKMFETSWPRGRCRWNGHPAANRAVADGGRG